MFKQITRFAVVALVWKQYKRAIVSTVLLFAFLYMVGTLHEDYLAYAKLNASAAVGLSFAIKWGAMLMGVMLFLLYHFYLRRSKPPKKPPTAPPLNSADDPFAAIRQRKKLRSKADMLVEHPPKKGDQ